MKQLNVAVCVSGQSRTWQAGLGYMKAFFNSPRCNVKFFAHTWDENHYKQPGHAKGWKPFIEVKLNAKVLRRQLLAADVRFEELVVDKQIAPREQTTRTNSTYFTSWAPMFKSAALSMAMKTRYEVENNMTFDVVFKTRFDVAYDPNFTVEHYIPVDIIPDGIYVHTTNFQSEFRMPVLSDIAYYGSSRAMNVLDSFWFYYDNGRFLEMLDYSDYNRAYDLVGPGVLLYKWATMKNLKIISNLRHFNPVPIRAHVADAFHPDGYKRIINAYTDNE